MREQLAAALGAYRQSRAGWRLDAPEPQGAEREFAEARRDMERAESGFMSRTRVAPREEGHEFDPAAARMTGQMAVQRAKAAAAQLPPALQPHAARYAAAQEKVLEAVNAIQGAATRSSRGSRAPTTPPRRTRSPRSPTTSPRSRRADQRPSSSAS